MRPRSLSWHTAPTRRSHRASCVVVGECNWGNLKLAKSPLDGNLTHVFASGAGHRPARFDRRTRKYQCWRCRALLGAMNDDGELKVGARGGMFSVCWRRAVDIRCSRYGTGNHVAGPGKAAKKRAAAGQVLDCGGLEIVAGANEVPSYVKAQWEKRKGVIADTWHHNKS